MHILLLTGVAATRSPTGPRIPRARARALARPRAHRAHRARRAPWSPTTSSGGRSTRARRPRG